MNNGIPEIDDGNPGLLEMINETGSPERRLLLGVLERAILDYVGNEEKEKLQATEWIFYDNDDDDNSDEFTFAWICSHLDLPASKIRSRIRAMPMRGSSRLAPWYFKDGSQPQDMTNQIKLDSPSNLDLVEKVILKQAS